MNRLLPIFLVLLTLRSHAAPTLAPVFTDGAVLQQGRNLPVWGKADPGEHVTVSFHGQQVGTTTDASGNWLVLLEPLAANASEEDLCIQGSTTLTLHRIIVGDVWLFIGQTALATTVEHEEGTRAEIPAAPIPLLRYFDASARDSSVWQIAAPASVPHFSAEAFFVGRQLHRKTGIPIGVIKVASSAGALSSWLSPAAINSTPALAFIPQRWQEEQASYASRLQTFQQALAEWKKAEQKARDSGPAKLAAFHQKKHLPKEPSLQAPSASFEQLLAPLQPFALRGILWHEEETNGLHANEYEMAAKIFIQSTRAHFAAPELPLILVQLGPQYSAPDSTEENWALIRHAQNSLLTTPNTFLVVSLDLGDAKSVHPFNVQELARRLGQSTLGVVYNIDVEYKGPSVRTAVVENGKLRLDFDHAATGLIAYKKPVQNLEVAGADGRFFPANALIHGASLSITCPSVSAPQTVRYAWSKAPFANLANGAGIPAAPFVIQLMQNPSGTTTH